MDFITPILEVTLKPLGAFIGKQFGYLYYYNRNIQSAESAVVDLRNVKCNVEGRVDRAKNNNETTKPDVVTWLERVEETGINKEKASSGEGQDGSCCNNNSINMISRYRLSRKALKTAEELRVLKAAGNFETVSDPPLAQGIVPGGANMAPYVYVEEESSSSKSRFIILKDVMEAIMDDTVRIIGIFGAGGMGKTTMVKKVFDLVKKKSLVDAVAMVNAKSQTTEIQMQDVIAHYLGLNFVIKDYVEIRARELRERFAKKKKALPDKFEKILVIFDNLTKPVELNDIGIPTAHGLDDCKIVLVSRDKQVCKEMKATRIFHFRSLVQEEGLKFLQNLTITFPQLTDKLESMGEEIIRISEGSPFAIKTYACQILSKTTDELADFSKQAEGYKFDGENAASMRALNWTYDMLEPKEVQNFFLLCCLFPEGFSIPTEDLIRYAWGYQLFNGVNKLREARVRAKKYVEQLRNLNFLEASESTAFVTIHDIAREFGILIADRSNHAFMVKYGETLSHWPKCGTYEICTAISLQCDDMENFPETPDCQDVNLLQLVVRKEYRQINLPDTFFNFMMKLKVLALRNMSIPKFKFMTNIRTLSLDNCKFIYDLSTMLGYLERLEILSCVNSNIKELPVEAKGLSKLRLLDLTGCKDFHRIAPGVLPFLVSLEELYMSSCTSLRWAEQNPENSYTNARFDELLSMPNLVAIEIEIPFEVFSIGSKVEPGFISKD